MIDKWFKEKLYPNSMQTYKIVEVIHNSQSSDAQEILIFENPEYGRMLTLDGIVQLTEKGHHPYHEMMGIMPLMAHGNVRNVLIVGGGDGAMAEHVLRYNQVKEVTLVDIEKGIFELAKEHLRFACKDVFADKRLEAITGDGAKFVEETNKFFDLIIVDSTDPELGDDSLGPSHPLYQKQFYQNCLDKLYRGGILVTHCGVPFKQGGQLKKVVDTIAGVGFDKVAPFMFDARDYVGGNMVAVFASKGADYCQIPVEVLARRFNSQTFGLKYYTTEIHKAAFVLPQYVLDSLG